MRTAVVVAIDSWQDSKFGKLKYAEADARDFAEALYEIGFERRDVHLILGQDATNTHVRSFIGDHAQSLHKDDQCFVYFAGHGINLNAENYLTFRDSRYADLMGTCLSLSDLFRIFKGSFCQQVAFFLDCCHAEFRIDDEMRGAVGAFDSDALTRAAVSVSEYLVGFAACAGNEKSNESKDLQHGVWTYYLTKALRAEVPSII